MTVCYPLIRGRAMRVTRLNGCGATVPGSQSVVVSKGFISVGLTANTEEGEDIQVTNANGDLCIYDIPAPRFTGYEVEINLCGVDPSLINLLTGQTLVDDPTSAGGDSPSRIGFRINSGINLDSSGFALELWTGIAGSACEDGEQSYGYLLIPFIKGGVLGDFTVENGAVNFVVQGAISKDGSAWGVGPFDVVTDDNGDPSPLVTAIDPKDHLHVQTTTIAPPTDQCGGQPLGSEATGATEVEGGEATLTPANSYAPYDLADAATGFTASPNTAWDTGSYVLTESGQHIYWNGTAWAAGDAP